MAKDASILVAGGGPVGLTAAVELARRGYAPRIIDNDGEPTPESRALAVNARTLDILEPCGVTERIIEAGNRINGMIFRSGGKELMRLEMRYLPHRFNFMIGLPQSQTEEILIQRLREYGHNVQWHTELQSLDGKSPKIGVTMKSSDGVKVSDADILIGADGAHSLVRKQLGLDFPGERAPYHFGLADVELDDWPFPFDHGIVHQDPGQIMAFFPLSEGFGRLVCNHPDVMNRLPAAAKVRKVIWESDFRISYRQVDAYQKGNVFLAGDAAHIHSPVGGRGMNLGIEDAATLAWLIEQNRTDEYTGRRHPVGAKVLNFTEAQTRQITEANPLQRFLQNWLAPFMLKFPAIQRLAVSRIVILGNG